MIVILMRSDYRIAHCCASNRLVSHGAWLFSLLPPCWHFSVQVNQIRFNHNLYVVDKQVNCGIRPERRGEVNTIARPKISGRINRSDDILTGDQSFGVGNRRIGVLYDAAIDILPIAIAELSVTLSTQLDAEDAIAPEDIGAQGREAADALIGRGRSHLVRLEEVNTRGREFDHLGQIHRDQVFHLCLAHRSVLEDVDGRVVARIGQYVAEGERVNDSAERLACLVERTNRTTGERLHAVTNCVQAQSRERAGARRSELGQYAGVNGVRAVSGCTDNARQGLAEAIGHFLRDVLDGAVDGGR